MKNKISIIIPVASLKTKEELELFHNALNSIDSQTTKPNDVVVVIPKEYKELISDKTYSFKLNIVSNNKDTSFGSQVNLGTSKAKGTHVMIMGMDDLLADFYIEEVYKYIENDEANTFLPLVMNVTDKGFSHLSNEIIWSQSFYNVEGIVDLESLKQIDNFLIYGMVVPKNNFIELGGVKPSIKLSYAKETLMRLVHNGMTIRVIPKMGYQRLVGREGSLTKQSESMSFNEIRFWLDLPQTEYLHLTDRNIAFDDKSVDNAEEK